MIKGIKSIGISILVFSCLFSSFSQGLEQNSIFPDLPPDLTNRVEALKRIDPSVIQSSDSIKSVVDKVFDSIIGHPVYVELTIRLDRKENAEQLIKFAEKYPDHYGSSEAIRYIMKSGNTSILTGRIKNDVKNNHPSTLSLIKLLAGSGSEDGSKILTDALLSPTSHPDIKRQIVGSLSSSKRGAQIVIDLKASGKLPEDIQLYSGQMLSLAPWPKTRELAAKHFSKVAGRGSVGLTMLDLKIFPSDIERGQKVYSDPVVGCFRCHVIEGKGTAFGPELSLIGDKLPPEAILNAIQEPSAGISFDYEAWEIELDTTEFIYGIIVSETEDFIVIRDSLGVDQRVSKSAIISREKSKASAMPAGLAQLISPKQMADLIAYLSNLKKEK